MMDRPIYTMPQRERSCSIASHCMERRRRVHTQSSRCGDIPGRLGFGRFTARPEDALFNTNRQRADEGSAQRLPVQAANGQFSAQSYWT